jgi:hypothetical protein
MNKNQQLALTLFVIGLLGLGVLALHYRDFALVWQPVPVWVPAPRTPQSPAPPARSCLLSESDSSFQVHGPGRCESFSCT